MTAARKRTKKPTTAAPLGLQAIFAAMQPYDFQGVYGATFPDAFVDVHKAIVQTSSEGNQHAFTNALAAATNQEYPGSTFGPGGKHRASECADVAVLGGFWSGVAACWFYMTAINGGTR